MQSDGVAFVALRGQSPQGAQLPGPLFRQRIRIEVAQGAEELCHQDRLALAPFALEGRSQRGQRLSRVFVRPVRLMGRPLHHAELEQVQRASIGVRGGPLAAEPLEVRPQPIDGRFLVDAVGDAIETISE